MNQRIPGVKHSFSLFSRFVSEFVNRVSAFITFPLMIKYLSTEAYGVNTQIQTLTNYLLTISSLGLGFYVIKELSGKIEIKILSKRFRSSLLLVGTASIFLSSIFLIFTEQINQWFFKVGWASSIIPWGVGIVVFSSLEQVVKDFLRARLQMVVYSGVQIVQAVIYVAGVAGILISGGDLLQIIQLTIIIKVVSILIMVIYLRAIGEIEFIGNFISTQEQIKAIQWGLPIVASALSVSIISTGDRAILGALTNATSVGIYGASYQLANVLLAIGAPFWSMLYPLMATFKNSQDSKNLSQVSKRYSNAFSVIGFPVLFGLLIIGPATLGYFGKSTFEIPVFTFLFIILGVFISQFCAPMLYLAYLYQKPKTILIITTISALLNIGLNILLIPHLGIFAAAINTTFTYAFMDYLLFRKIPSTGFQEKDFFDYRNIGKYFLSSIIMAIALANAKTVFPLNLINLVTLISCSAIIYALCLFVLYRFSPAKLLKPLLG